MNVASLELCRELYELSGWDGRSCYHYWNTALSSDRGLRDANGKSYANFDGWVPHGGYRQRGVICATPAYDLGYLLRKLPLFRRKEVGTTRLKFRYYYLDVTAGHSTGSWVAGYRAVARDKYERIYFTNAAADTPEDAACKLAIELFKSGVLSK